MTYHIKIILIPKFEDSYKVPLRCPENRLINVLMSTKGYSHYVL